MEFSEGLKKKVEQAIKLLQSIKTDEPIEVSYSGGKDSDVILGLAKMAGIKYHAIYKNTTIDPPGTIKHCRENGVEVFQPSMRFFDIVKKKGFPTRRARFCCDKLKEYKVLNFAIQGIRKSESKARDKRYNEPIICRIYGSKKNNVQVILPILNWTVEDVEEFINARGIKCHPLYYNDDGTFNVKKRLGCIGCPLKSDNGLADFKKYPNIVKAWINAGMVWWNTHPNAKSHKNYESIYDLFVHNVFFDSYTKFREWKYNLFETVDCKKFLEDYFKIKL